MTDLTGKTIAKRYRVDAFIGRGGMAEVYKVWDTRRAVYLAMKVLHADLAQDRAFLRRFTREAQTLEKLQHPNIVRFYGLDQDGRLSFISMDYVDGPPCARRSSMQRVRCPSNGYRRFCDQFARRCITRMTLGSYIAISNRPTL